MDCEKVKQMISDYIDDNLSAEERNAVSMHIKNCIDCRRQVDAYKDIWDALLVWEDIKPEGGYMSRFWTKLSLSEPWYKKIFRDIETVLGVPYRIKLVPVFAVIVIFISIYSLNIYRHKENTDIIISQISKENLDLDMIENIDLAEDYDVIAHLDLLEDMDILEKIDLSSA